MEKRYSPDKINKVIYTTDTQFLTHFTMIFCRHFDHEFIIKFFQSVSQQKYHEIDHFFGWIRIKVEDKLFVEGID